MSSVSFLFPNPNPYLASVDLVFLCFEMCVVRVCVREHMCVCACEHNFGVATNHRKFKV